jgi:hypothetical protein
MKQPLENITQSEPFSNRVVSEQGVFEHALYISNQQKISEDYLLNMVYGQVYIKILADIGFMI